MNIVSNNCFGGFIYKYANLKYENPFIWTAILGSSLETLLFNYDNIDFSNIYLHDVSGHYGYNLVVDDKLDVKFWSHYKYDANANKPYKKGDSIYSNNIGEYILNTYRKRLQRMTKPPVFVLYWWKGLSTGTADYWKTPPPTDDIEYLSKLLDKEFPYRTLIIGPYQEFDKFIGNNVTFLYDSNTWFPTRSPAFAAKNRLQEIMAFVSET